MSKSNLLTCSDRWQKEKKPWKRQECLRCKICVRYRHHCTRLHLDLVVGIGHKPVDVNNDAVNSDRYVKMSVIYLTDVSIRITDPDILVTEGIVPDGAGRTSELQPGPRLADRNWIQELRWWPLVYRSR